MRKLLQYTGAGYLLFLMLLKTMGMQIAVLDYQINRDFIAENLCENRFSPEKQCAGKCYLKKQLSSSSESTGSQEGRTASKTFSVDYFEALESVDFSRPAPVIVHHAVPDDQGSGYLFAADIFHPPLRPAV